MCGLFGKQCQAAISQIHASYVLQIQCLGPERYNAAVKQFRNYSSLSKAFLQISTEAL